MGGVGGRICIQEKSDTGVFGFVFFSSIQAHSYTSNLALHLDEAMNNLAHIN